MLEGIGLALRIRPVNGALLLLAIMDIRAIVLILRKALRGRLGHQIRVRRRDRFSISSIQLADLGSQLSATGSLKVLDFTPHLL